MKISILCVATPLLLCFQMTWQKQSSDENYNFGMRPENYLLQLYLKKVEAAQAELAELDSTAGLQDEVKTKRNAIPYFHDTIKHQQHSQPIHNFAKRSKREPATDQYQDPNYEAQYSSGDQSSYPSSSNNYLLRSQYNYPGTSIYQIPYDPNYPFYPGTYFYGNNPTSGNGYNPYGGDGSDPQQYADSYDPLIASYSLPFPYNIYNNPYLTAPYPNVYIPEDLFAPYKYEFPPAEPDYPAHPSEYVPPPIYSSSYVAKPDAPPTFADYSTLNNLIFPVTLATSKYTPVAAPPIYRPISPYYSEDSSFKPYPNAPSAFSYSYKPQPYQYLRSSDPAASPPPYNNKRETGITENKRNKRNYQHVQKAATNSESNKQVAAEPLKSENNPSSTSSTPPTTSTTKTNPQVAVAAKSDATTVTPISTTTTPTTLRPAVGVENQSATTSTTTPTPAPTTPAPTTPAPTTPALTTHAPTTTAPTTPSPTTPSPTTTAPTTPAKTTPAPTTPAPTTTTQATTKPTSTTITPSRVQVQDQIQLSTTPSSTTPAPTTPSPTTPAPTTTTQATTKPTSTTITPSRVQVQDIQLSTTPSSTTPAPTTPAPTTPAPTTPAPTTPAPTTTPAHITPQTTTTSAPTTVLAAKRQFVQAENGAVVADSTSSTTPPTSTIVNKPIVQSGVVVANGVGGGSSISWPSPQKYPSNDYYWYPPPHYPSQPRPYHFNDNSHYHGHHNSYKQHPHHKPKHNFHDGQTHYYYSEVHDHGVIGPAKYNPKYSYKGSQAPIDESVSINFANFLRPPPKVPNSYYSTQIEKKPKQGSYSKQKRVKTPSNKKSKKQQKSSIKITSNKNPNPHQEGYNKKQYIQSSDSNRYETQHSSDRGGYQESQRHDDEYSVTYGQGSEQNYGQSYPASYSDSDKNKSPYRKPKNRKESNTAQYSNQGSYKSNPGSQYNTEPYRPISYSQSKKTGYGETNRYVASNSYRDDEEDSSYNNNYAHARPSANSGTYPVETYRDTPSRSNYKLEDPPSFYDNDNEPYGQYSLQIGGYKDVSNQPYDNSYRPRSQYNQPTQQEDRSHDSGRKYDSDKHKTKTSSAKTVNKSKNKNENNYNTNNRQNSYSQSAKVQKSNGSGYR